MRLLPLIALCLSLLSATTVEARLFWQTYGSTISADGSCGADCTWNSNQDYFVPRHSSSGRYGLFSPCKTSCTTSPACKRCHPDYPGYCGIYGACHYGWRNHVYKAYCGCAPVRACRVPWRNACDKTCESAGCAGNCQAAAPYLQEGSLGYLPNVESSQMVVLGSISAEGDGLLMNLDLASGAVPVESDLLEQLEAIVPSQTLPSLRGLQSEESAQPLPSPQTKD